MVFPILYYILIHQSFKELCFKRDLFSTRRRASPLDFGAKKLEPSDDSNFNTLGFCSNVLRHLHSLSGEKGNTLVSQKRMQRYDKFFIYANFSRKNMHFLLFLPNLCKTMITNWVN